MKQEDQYEYRELIDKAIKVLHIECDRDAQPRSSMLETAISLLQDAKGLFAKNLSF